MVKIFKSSAKSKQIKQKHVELSIESLDQLSRGVGRVNGKVCFVAGALPGETVKAQITEDKKQFCQAKLVKIIHASPERVEPECPWFNQCGGCQLQHLAVQNQIDVKQLRVDDLFAKSGIKNLPWQKALQGESWQYRTRTRLSTWYEGKHNRLRVGFRQLNSKKLIEIDQCLVIAPLFSKLLPDLVQTLNLLECKKHITHLEFNSASEYKVIVLRVLKALTDKDMKRLSAFSSEHKFSLYLLDDNAHYTAVRADESELFYQIDDLHVRFGLSDFTQVNQQMNLAMIRQAKDWLDLKTDDCLLDLFCGLGNFSLPMAQKVQSVTGIEGSQSMVEKAQANAEFNHLDNLSFIKRDLNQGDALAEIDLAQFNKIILDPSRDGAAKITQNSHIWSANLVLYIACEPNALVRDTQLLLANGYQLQKISVIDMFPHTSHVETMALFRKCK